MIARANYRHGIRARTAGSVLRASRCGETGETQHALTNSGVAPVVRNGYLPEMLYLLQGLAWSPCAVELCEKSMFRWVRLSVNGRPQWFELKGETENIAGLLRSLGLVGPKTACVTGHCAACTVLVGDNPVRSCAIKSEECAGKDVTTAEHLDTGSSLHPMLVAFRNHGIATCTICMPGIVLAAIAYAARDRELTEDEVSRDFVADLCHCANAGNLTVAVLDGARSMHNRRGLAGEM